MKPLMHIALGKIEDESIRLLVQDLCEMFNWRVSDYQEYTFFEFLGVILKENAKSFSLANIALPRVIDRKLETLRDQGVFQLFRELKNDDTSQLRGELTLFAFLKKHLATLRAPVKERPPLTDYERDVEIAMQRRRNRDCSGGL